jgi:hypothetical protein
MNDPFNPLISRGGIQSPPRASRQFARNGPTPAKPTVKSLFIGLTNGMGLIRPLCIQKRFSEKIRTVDRVTYSLTTQEVCCTRSIPYR